LGNVVEENISERVPAYTTVKKYQLWKQSGLSKKDENNLLSHATSPVLLRVKEDKIKLENAKSKVMIIAIQHTYTVYCGKEFSSLC
jgi:hypothetical protein